ncbi:MAG: FkbM family methyltransferase [Planctomycetota bacterium]
MRIEDVTDYFRLRRLAANPWAVLRFRKRHALGSALQVELRAGPRLNLRGGFPDFHMFHRIFLRDEYRIAAHCSGPLECVVDLGANVGIFAAFAAARARRVVACEPMPNNFRELTANLAGLNNVALVRAAIAATPGTLRLYRPRLEMLTGTYSAHPDPTRYVIEDPEQVPALTLDQLFVEQSITRCDLLKIDIEGHEYEVLHATSSATLAKIQRIHGEYHDVRPEDPRTRIDHFREFLTRCGYRVELLPHRRKPNHGMFFAGRPSGEGQ